MVSASTRVKSFVVLAVLFGSAPVDAETQTEILDEARTVLAFKVPDAAVAGALPTGWTANVAPSGPFNGANFIVVLIDRKLVTDPKGQTLTAGGPSSLSVLVIPGKNTSGAAGPVVVGGFIEPAGAPGAYGAYTAATTTLDKKLHVGADPAEEETWSFASKEGDSLDVHLRFTPASPVPSTFDSRTYSAAKPGFYRISRGNQGNALLRAPGAADRVQHHGYGQRATPGQVL